MILNFENNVIYGIFLYSGLAVARNIWRNSLRGTEGPPTPRNAYMATLGTPD